MDIKIVKAEQLPEQIETLAKLARKEGYDLIDKLIEEYHTGKNCFSHENEYLALAYDGDKLVACGGLNQQWGDHVVEARIGRVRRCYVHPKYRQHGVGKQLLAFLEQLARPHYSALCLHTDTKLAASFYQKQNYVFVENHPNYNYFKYLIS
ncbi:GNAT family N-acetyltransferase [Acinetobacter wanghuae]|uniref:GNAT family N-acetyltransferase n=1 Tax=Acinetobacter wanghuae TaxID=2662362 RepID=A0A5Q0P1M4_9GAMM|nr:GNAT family N-acetyltransferase [Acinetobacter wanghuae]MQW91632.1 GNAT family N-acetyltransferase [Acinetobacter wanghuae]QGA10985.1 GNAT family N-acetyltransferase [Acinetobacter wanghuae]